MSALTLKADLTAAAREVSYGPEAVASFDHLVSAAEPMKVKLGFLA